MTGSRQVPFIARGSSHEVRAHLAVAHGRRYLTDAELKGLSGKYEEIARMLTGLSNTSAPATAKNAGRGLFDWTARLRLLTADC